MYEDGDRIQENGSHIVMDKMEPLPEARSDEPKDQSFQDLFEGTFNSIQEGEVLKGRIVLVGKEYVMVDVGYKSEGQIPVLEFQEGLAFRVNPQLGPGLVCGIAQVQNGGAVFLNADFAPGSARGIPEENLLRL